MACENTELCHSEYVHPNGVWESVYNDYKEYGKLQARKQHKQPTAFDSKDDSKLPARNFPYIPMAPHRLSRYDIPIGPGLSTPDMKTWT